MEVYECSLNEIYSLGKLYISEQNLEITLNSQFNVFDSWGNMYVIIGYDADHTLHHRSSKLMCGIVELKKVIDQDRTYYLQRLVLPFTNKLLYAKFQNDNKVLLVFKDQKIEKREVQLDANYHILPEDYAYLLDYKEHAPIKELGDYTEIEMPMNLVLK